MRKRDRHHHRETAESEPPAEGQTADVRSDVRSDAKADGTADGTPDGTPDGTADERADVTSADASDVGSGATSLATSASRELEEMRDKYLRLAAEYDNYRRRTSKEKIEAESRGQSNLVSRLLEAIDDIARFAHIDPTTTDATTLHKGIEMVEQKLLKTLGAAGLEVINPVDQTFDPKEHEAVATEPALSAEDDHTVGKVFQNGYRFNGQLLRPARVVVKQWNG